MSSSFFYSLLTRVGKISVGIPHFKLLINAHLIKAANLQHRHVYSRQKHHASFSVTDKDSPVKTSINRQHGELCILRIL